MELPIDLGKVTNDDMSFNYNDYTFVLVYKKEDGSLDRRHVNFEYLDYESIPDSYFIQPNKIKLNKTYVVKYTENGKTISKPLTYVSTNENGYIFQYKHSRQLINFLDLISIRHENNYRKIKNYDSDDDESDNDESDNDESDDDESDDDESDDDEYSGKLNTKFKYKSVKVPITEDEEDDLSQVDGGKRKYKTNRKNKSKTKRKSKRKTKRKSRRC